MHLHARVVAACTEDPRPRWTWCSGKRLATEGAGAAHVVDRPPASERDSATHGHASLRDRAVLEPVAITPTPAVPDWRRPPMSRRERLPGETKSQCDQHRAEQTVHRAP